MFGRIARATFHGLLRWPDLMVFGLLAFGLSVALEAVMTPLWGRLASSGADPFSTGTLVIGLIMSISQQFVLTFASILIVVAATRVVLARLRGGQMSVAEGLKIGEYVRPIARYALLYTAVSVAIAVAMLLILFGTAGIALGSLMTTSGIGGLTQIPTGSLGASTSLILVIFLPLLIVWGLANMLVSPVIAAEGAGSWQAIARSWGLVRGTWGVVLGLILTIFAFACVLSLILSFFIQADTVSSSLALSSGTATLPDLPFVISAILSALLFVVGAIFSAAWYLVAQENPDAPVEIRAD